MPVCQDAHLRYSVMIKIPISDEEHYLPIHKVRPATFLRKTLSANRQSPFLLEMIKNVDSILHG